MIRRDCHCCRGALFFIDLFWLLSSFYYRLGRVACCRERSVWSVSNASRPGKNVTQPGLWPRPLLFRLRLAPVWEIKRRPETETRPTRHRLTTPSSYVNKMVCRSTTRLSQLARRTAASTLAKATLTCRRSS